MIFSHRNLSLVSAAAILLCICAAASAQSTVNGYLKVGKSDYEMKHITAIRVPNTFQPGQFATRLSISDLPVTEEQLKDPFGVARLKNKGGFHGVTLEIGDEMSYSTLNLWSSDSDTMISVSGSMPELELTANTPALIMGQVKNLDRTMSGVRFQLYVGFSSVLKEPAAAPSGAAKTGAAVAELEAVKIYLAMRKAVKSGDMAAIKKLARYPQDFEGPDGQKFLKFMQSEEPSDIEVVEATEGADTAKLTVTGVKDGKPIRRTFEMQKKDGRWSTNNDNWEAN